MPGPLKLAVLHTWEPRGDKHLSYLESLHAMAPSPKQLIPVVLGQELAGPLQDPRPLGMK